jgi:uncharacterized protein (TIGR03067 family)
MPQRCLLALPTALLFVAALLPAVAQDKGDPAKGDPAKKDAELLQGTFNFAKVEIDGVKQPRKMKGEPFQTITFKGDKFEVKRGDTVLQAGTFKLDATKNPRTIDITINEGDAKGTVQLGIYEVVGDAFNLCFDPQGKKRPTEFKSPADSGITLAALQRERQQGVDPMDPSIVYDKPWQMGSGFKAYNGAAYDKAALCVGPKTKLVLPDKDTIVEQHDKADVVLICMEKRAVIRAHFARAVSITDYRPRLGVAAKLEKGELFIGTFGEFGFLEGSVNMKLLVLVPAKLEVVRREGLSAGYGGRAGVDRPEKAINPTKDDPKPALTKTKDGMPNCWLPPAAEDGWHEIPAVADVERRAAKKKE